MSIVARLTRTPKAMAIVREKVVEEAELEVVYTTISAPRRW